MAWTADHPPQYLHRTMYTVPCRTTPDETVLITLDDGQGAARLHIRLPDGQEDITEAGRLLATLGSPPAWWPHLTLLETVLTRCPDVDGHQLLDHLAAPIRQRTRIARQVDETTPLWLGWALTFDPKPEIDQTWARQMPTTGAYRDMLDVLLDDPDRAGAALTRLDIDDPGEVDAAIASGTPHRLRWAVTKAHVPRDRLHDLAVRTQEHHELTLALACRTDLTEDAALVLSLSTYTATLTAIANHPHTPPDVIQRLQQHPSEPVAGAAWIHQHRAYTERLGPEDPHNDPDYLAFEERWHDWQIATYGHVIPAGA